MNFIEEMTQKYEIGLPTFRILFELKSKDLKDKLKEIVKDKLSEHDYSYILGDNGVVCKKIKNDEPEELEIHFYSSISITPLGIYFKPEHGETKKLVEFDKFFKLV